ncbi:hypothetical protein BRC85_06015 [Halobacteriales archaeon QS_1_69_70]|nr:MAG: hypothetical protein BRC85_06015 [Halobacteriales archaeon QS_1_69_70]
MPGDRAQSHVVGVALLLGVTVVAFGTLTASIGTVVEGNAARADTQRVADDLADAMEPVAVTGVNRGRVAFTEGRLHPVERDLRVLDESGVVRRVGVGGLVFRHGDQRVASVAGAVTVGRNGSATLAARPPITASRGAGVLVVGAARLGDPTGIGGTDVRTTIRTDVSHRRASMGNGTYRVAVETRTPGAWERYFRRQNATTIRRSFDDDDGGASVVASYPGERVGYLVYHDLHAEVRGG